jgi:hypothetical protein
MKIKVYVSTNKINSKCERIIEIEEPRSSEEEIEQIARETMFEMIEWNWEEI